MSKQMKIIAAVAGVLVLAAVVLTMFGKPPNLPLGPLQGMLAKEEPAVDDTATTDPGAIAAADCGTGTTTPGSGTGAVDPAATDPAAGGAVDPAASGAGATDPTTGAPVASAADGWTGGDRVLAAGEGTYDPGRVSDTVIVAADVATDPAAGGAVDPAAAGAVDPAAAGAVDPAAAGAVDPAAAGAVDPAAAGAADPAAGGAVDPCAGAGGVTDPATGGTGAATDPTTGAPSTGAGATGGAATGGAASTTTTTDGTNSGNSPEALRAAKDATGVMTKAKINVSTTATLVPSTGGITKLAALKRYRATVTGAVLVMKLDAEAQTQWTSAGKKVQIQLVKSFLTRLGKSYAKSSRSITITDSSGNVLAIGDAAPRRAATVKLL